jgi:GTP pyrophosphokinase
MKEQIVRIMDIHDVLLKNSVFDLDKLFSAYIYAATKHRGQLRKSGAPYLSHPLSVAKILAEMNMDLDTVVSGLLHDTLEDTDATYDEIKNLFGEDVAFLVDGVSKISKIRFKSKEEKQAENFRKMLVSVSKDVRVILIKLADRLHNMQTIGYLPEEKARRIAEETLEIYAPLAHRLGIAWVKWELEDLCFRVLEPEKYYDIYNRVKLKRSEREQYLNKVKSIVEKELLKNNLKNFEITGRPKHFYSIYHKMVIKKTSFDEIYDLIALRVLVNTVSECYAALGIIHNLWKPIPGRFKDFIAMPKSNMYQSLHTTVVGPDGLRVEFQLRTYVMHKIAEEGIAAHWKYKEGKDFLISNEEKTFTWLRQLLEQKELNKPTDLVEALKEDVLSYQIYVFTPQGDIVELPVNSTPVDFAYAIHTEIGHKCVGAKVDGRIVPLRYRLKNGEKVEILTSSKSEPKSDWLNFVKTSRSRIRIKSYLRKKEQDKALEYGVYLLQKEFKEHNLDLKDIVENQKNFDLIAKKFTIKSADDLYLNIGYGRISVKQLLHLFVEDESPVKVQTIPEKKHVGPFIIDNIDNMLVHSAKCCAPIPGDEIVGYITNTRGVVVHRTDCHNLKLPTVNTDKIIEVEWDASLKYNMPVNISLISTDRQGLLNDITAVLKELGVNIIELSAKSINMNMARQFLKIEIANKEELNYILSKLKGISGVQKVTTS